jgi:hypothetical protein
LCGGAPFATSFFSSDKRMERSGMLSINVLVVFKHPGDIYVLATYIENE